MTCTGVLDLISHYCSYKDGYSEKYFEIPFLSCKQKGHNLYLSSEIFFMQLTSIQKKIHEVRGYRIMIDRDLAELYEVPTKSLNLAV